MWRRRREDRLPRLPRTHWSKALCCRWVERATGLPKIRGGGGGVASGTSHAIDGIKDRRGSDLCMVST
jgi:hypothetical protein